MHGIAKQIRIMNENNTYLIQHLTMNNPPPTTALAQEETNQPRHSHQLGNHDSQSHHSTGRATPPEVIANNHQVCTLGEKEVLSFQNLGPQVGLLVWTTRKPREERDHLAVMIELLNAEIDQPLIRLKIWMLELMPSTPVQVLPLLWTP